MDDPTDERTQKSTRGVRRAGGSDSRTPPARSEPARPSLPPTPRYRAIGVLGRGGMGEVTLVEDVRIGRLVACKSIPADLEFAPSMRTRFLREARLQGQLEHPAIVPVYDVDRADDGSDFFTMKRISGLTLGQILKGLRAGDAPMRARFSQHKLLAIFQQICLAMDYAHQRGIVHRDLKPTNVMVGDFGEVYVLDWGIAKIPTTDDPEVRPGERPFGTGSEDSTQAHDMLGTPGYIAPEQIDDPSSVDARADVYALGALLFHLLALEPMLAPNSPESVPRASRGAFDPRPSVRVPDLALGPELDLICEKATALDPDDRYESARALHDAVEAYLEGRRDVTHRREMADRHVALARAALERSSDAHDSAARGEALRNAGHALALDPGHEEAGAVLSRLLLEPPARVPDEVETALAKANRSLLERISERAAAPLLAYCLFALLLLVSGMRDPFGYVALFGPVVLASGVAAASRFLPGRWFDAGYWLVAIAVAISTAMSAGLFGPFVLTPIFALSLVMVGSTFPEVGRIRPVMVAVGLLAFLLPAIAETAGWVPRSYEFEPGRIIIHARFTPFPEVPVRLGLTLAISLSLGFVGLMGWRLSDEIGRARREQELRTWSMRQLVPDDVARTETAERAASARGAQDADVRSTVKKR